MKTLIAILILASPAYADPYKTSVSTQLATLDSAGGSIQAERAFGTHKLSALVAIGGRSSAQGEYSSTTTGIGFELRRWLRRPESMTGWYVALRTDFARTNVDDEMEDRTIGTMKTWTMGASTGFRWVLFDRVEITPSLGAAMVVENGTNSPTTTARVAPVVGVTLGGIF
jgi:hypothetical protein